MQHYPSSRSLHQQSQPEANPPTRSTPLPVMKQFGTPGIFVNHSQSQGEIKQMKSTTSFTQQRQAPPPPPSTQFPSTSSNLSQHRQSQSSSNKGTPSRQQVDPEEYYVKQHRIGKGSFGEVYKGYERRTTLPVAIKIIDLEAAEDEIEDIQMEIQVLGQMDSEWVTRYHGAFLKQSHLWIVMEYCSGGSVGDLLKAVGPFREEYIAILARELLKGLEYLHGENKLHRDIKAANILLTSNGGVKLADFGVSGQLSATMTKKNTFVGTPYWMSPEVIKQSGYSYSADIWSLGITLIEMAKLEPPYADLHPMKVLFLIPRNPPPVLEEKFSKPFREFVSLCLQRDPNARPSAKELLKHRFIRSAKRKEYLTELIERAASEQLNKENDKPIEDKQTARFGLPEDNLWDFGTVKNAIGSAASGTLPRPSNADSLPIRAESSRSGQAMSDIDNKGHLSQQAHGERSHTGGGTVGTVQRARGPLPRPPSLQSLQGGSPAPHGGHRGKGNEIFETIRHAPTQTQMQQGYGSGHARDRAGYGTETHQDHSQTGAVTASAIGNTIDRAGDGVQLGDGLNGMDDMMLDSVIIPALDNLSLRVPNNEARQALRNLRLAFEEAERYVPGVCVALVAEIVESVEQVDEDGDL